MFDRDGNGQRAMIEVLERIHAEQRAAGDQLKRIVEIQLAMHVELTQLKDGQIRLKDGQTRLTDEVMRTNEKLDVLAFAFRDDRRRVDDLEMRVARIEAVVGAPAAPAR